MKIAIVSDMHIGYERFHEDAIRQAREAMELASAMADAIILPGDIFDKRAPKPEVIAEAINLFRSKAEKSWRAKVVEFRCGRENHTDVPVIAISGTHERTAAGKDNPLSLLGLAGLLVDTNEATTIIEKDGERVAVFGLGGLSEERVKEKLAELDPKPVAGVFSIFMFHQSIYEILPFSEDFIHYGDLPRGFDLYVNGHVHSIVEATVHGKPFLIPGSTVLTQLKEGEQEQKGFMVFDTRTKTYVFVKIDSRRMFARTIKFDDADPEEVKRKCESQIEELLGQSDKKPVIRLKLVGRISDGFDSADMPLQAIAMKYADRAVIDIDSAKLVSKELEEGINEIRDTREGGTSIRELGMRMLIEKLKEQKFGDDINASDLFQILSSGTKKEKVIAEALELLANSGGAPPG